MSQNTHREWSVDYRDGEVSTDLTRSEARKLVEQWLDYAGSCPIVRYRGKKIIVFVGKFGGKVMCAFTGPDGAMYFVEEPK